MALTNDQITAQNFKDFYSEIRPYLNGNSPLAVNTFNKSDLYDTTEKIVGRWIDGKPLYQRVINYTSAIPNNTTTTLTFSSLGITGQDAFFVIGGFGYYNLGGTTPTPMAIPYFTAGGDMVTATALGDNLLITMKGTSYGLTGFRLIVQYTKTNDTQMSISDGNEYSLDEQIIGHWINGKPIYQKSFTATITTANTTTLVAANLFSTYNIDEIVGLDGILTEYNGAGSGKGALPLTYAYFNGTGDMHTAYVSNDGNLYTCGRYRGKVVYHLRYTKTTD